jgi:hypothetical protein
LLNSLPRLDEGERRDADIGLPPVLLNNPKPILSPRARMFSSLQRKSAAV